jgi:3-oxoadipate enol-lactonase
VKEQRVEVAGRHLWTARGGSGETLLLLPGMMAHHRYWRPAFLDELRASYELVALDYRGTGASDPAREPFAISDLATDVWEVLEALGIETTSVFGFSMGGVVALELALRWPERIEQLVLAAPAVAIEGPPLNSTELSRISRVLRSGDLERSLQVTWEANVSIDFRDDRAGYVDWVEAAAAHRMSLRTIEHQLAAIDGYSPAAPLDELHVPTLVLHGGEDRLVPLARSRLLVDQLPRADLRTFEGAGHLFFWERPHAAAQAIIEWTAAGHTMTNGG